MLQQMALFESSILDKHSGLLHFLFRGVPGIFVNFGKLILFLGLYLKFILSLSKYSVSI